MNKINEDSIYSLGSIDKLTVQKSRPLFALWQSELTLAEFKILDTYLSRIDSHKPERRVVVFEKGELEKILGVKKINNKELESRLKHLMGNVVKIPDIDEKKGFRLITLFEEAVAEQDEYGVWNVKMECTQKAMKYIFNIENLGYFRYKLRCITSITSRYTYIMFLYLETNRFRKTWEIALSDLKEILACEKVETYAAFKEFNKQVLKRAQKELLEKTDCRYSYEPIKKGRTVVAIRFTVETLSKSAIEAIDTDELPIDQEFDGEKELWENAIAEFEFTEDQIMLLKEVLYCIPKTKMPESTACPGNMNLMRYHYLKIKAAELNCRTNIKNKYAYLLKILEKDAGI